MCGSLRIFGILLYKSWLVRKRQWVNTLFLEILLPVAMVAFLWYMTKFGGNDGPPEEVKTDSFYEKQSLDQLLNLITTPIFTLYAPNNTFTTELMANVQKCTKNRLEPIRAFALENKLNAFYRNAMESNERFPGLPHVIVFDEPADHSVKHLNYKLRFQNQIKEISMSLFNYDTNSTTLETNLYRYYMLTNRLTQMQICIERSFINMKSGNKPIPDINIQRVPYPAHVKLIPFGDELRKILNEILLAAFLLPLLIETQRATKEKFSGTHVLMSMNGISNKLNLLSWIISGVLLLSVSFILLIFLMLIYSPGFNLPYMYYGNPVILYLMLIFYLAHLLACGIHVSGYFSNSSIVTIALLLKYELGMNLKSYAFKDNTLYLAPYVGVIFPSVLLELALEEIQTYENRAEGIQWYNLFMYTNPATKTAGSVGMFLILSVIGMSLHFLLAIYLYAVNPGKYGAAKHPLYFLKCKSKGNDDRIIESVDYGGTNFEPTTEGVYTPGIQIRNLTKTYTMNLFTRQKLHALRGLSVDFYKGQMTSLLGHNGAGKTTMMSILTGMISPTDGVVLINSKNLKYNASEIKKDMGLCTQENMYFSELTVSEQLLFFALVKRKRKPKSSVRELLKNLKLYEKRNALPQTLSGGQKRRLCLGMALVGDSSILILDEPTSGLDPESRRVIWNMLLKMRGKKTIILSTHDMEEADVLGDRIAIMHTGQLKSCGTSLFLKKLIGQNTVEITLSIEPRSDPEKIRGELHREGIIISREARNIVVKIPNTPGLPDTLDNLEKRKKDLGITGFSVSLISLEQVFLKITQENEVSQQSVDNEVTKLKGCAYCMQTVRALLSKKLTYTLKDLSTIAQKIWMIGMALIIQTIILKGLYAGLQYDGKFAAINLGMYHQPDVLYTSYDKSFGYRYETVSQKFGGNLIEVTDSNLQNALLHRAKDNLVLYNNYLIAAAEINQNYVSAFYSEIATFSLPISINLLSNAMLKNLMGTGYSISLSMEELPMMILAYQDLSDILGYMVALPFCSVFYSAIAFFVVHSNRETNRGVKHLQKMTGVSGILYWGTMFFSELLEYTLLIALVLASFVCIDLFLKFGLYGLAEIKMEVILFLLFGVNILPFFYIVSFFKRKTSTVVPYLTNGPAALVVLDSIFAFVKYTKPDISVLKSIRLIQRQIFLLLPYVSFFHSQVSFFRTVEANARCQRLPNDYYDTLCGIVGFSDICCDFDCYDGKCKKSQSFFAYEDYDANMKDSFFHLCVTPILWFVILALMECRCFRTVRSKPVKKPRVEFQSDADEQVQQEKAMIYERIQTLRGNRPSSVSDSSQAQNAESSDNPMFLVYELRKSYGKTKAVKDVSFGVKRRECFGLLGVNGAGKSTTFRMMIGEEIPDYGIMYIEDKDFAKNGKYFLSQMGYCPQHDAILKRLNTYDHLKLFARLRGIPEKQVKNEVKAWIERLNLKACAKQPSVTYSGGNKRRLNIAMALIGNPNMILMDEPTTGVDPGARRSLWNVIKACQMAGQSVILTSHSMEECEALCNRLAIMVDGKLVCIGASAQLKQRFGAGYDIKIKMDPEKAKDQVDSIKEDMARKLNCELSDENVGNLLYHVAPAGTTWRKMYDVMKEMKNKYDCIEDYSVLSSSLEKLFLLFAKSSSSNSTS